MSFAHIYIYIYIDVYLTAYACRVSKYDHFLSKYLDTIKLICIWLMESCYISVEGSSRIGHK